MKACVDVASVFLYGVLAGLLVSVTFYGVSFIVQLVRQAPDDIS